MRVRFLAALATAIAITFGLVTLVGLLLDEGPIGVLSDLLLRVVTIIIALTVLIGVLNLLVVHLGRVGGRKGGWVYSIVMLVSFFAVIILTVLERLGVLGGQPAPSMILLESVQVSIESALAGLVLFALVFGASRLLHRQLSWWGALFTVSLLVILLGSLPLSNLNTLVQVRDWMLAVPVSAGERGILLGISLGTVVTGVRVLIGQDRSYRD